MGLKALIGLQNLTSLSLFSLQNPSILLAIAMPILFEHSAGLSCFPSIPIHLLFISTFKLVLADRYRLSKKKALEPALAQKHNRKIRGRSLFCFFLGHKPFFMNAKREMEQNIDLSWKSNRKLKSLWLLIPLVSGVLLSGTPEALWAVT